MASATPSGFHGARDVSDDEPEDPMPELADFIDLEADSNGVNPDSSTSGPGPVALESTLDPMHPEPACRV